MEKKSIKEQFNKRKIGFILFMAVIFIIQFNIDPMIELTKGSGLGRLFYIISVTANAALIYLTVHLIWKMVFYYQQADRRTLLATAGRSPEGAGFALIGIGLQMMVILGSVFAALLL